MKELCNKIWEALLSALPITAIVFLVSLLPGIHFSSTELVTFSVGAVLLVLGIGLFNMGRKAQGIVFSLPVSDVAGLVKLPEETESEQS